MSQKVSDAKRRAIKRYDETHTKQINLKLNLKTDAKILKHFQTIGNVQGYIKQLIKKDLEGVKMYKVKPEYLDLWEGCDTPSNPDRVLTEEEVLEFAKEWETEPEELKEQLEEI